jgi:hypothetical protein
MPVQQTSGNHCNRRLENQDLNHLQSPNTYAGCTSFQPKSAMSWTTLALALDQKDSFPDTLLRRKSYHQSKLQVESLLDF